MKKRLAGGVYTFNKDHAEAFVDAVTTMVRYANESGDPSLSANVGETPASLGITVGRWKVRTDGSREGFDDVERASRPRAGG